MATNLKKQSSAATKRAPRRAAKKPELGVHAAIARLSLAPVGVDAAAEADVDDELDLDADDETQKPVPTAEELQARAQLKAVLLPLLKDSLRIRVESGHFTSPNDRTIKVFLDDECLTECTFDIRARREYEG